MAHISGSPSRLSLCSDAAPVPTAIESIMYAEQSRAVSVYSDLQPASSQHELESLPRNFTLQRHSSWKVCQKQAVVNADVDVGGFFFPVGLLRFHTHIFVLVLVV